MKKYVLVLAMLVLPLAFATCTEDPAEDVKPQLEVPESQGFTDTEEAEEDI